MEALITSTATVALAEIGDKTQLLALFLTLRYSNKFAIVAGIFVATLLNHAASAWLGQWLAQFIQSEIGQIVLAGSFIALGLWLLVPDKEDDDIADNPRFGAFVMTSLLFFVAEIGDKTQIATVLLGAEFNALIWVTLGTTLGMMLANVPVVFGGQWLMDKMPMTMAHRLAAALFIGFGLFQAWQV
ncbi:MAG TPA: TMEM165/GDT1 family protein [Pseudomonadales bacterium]|nr:TMEM165/GDT1 family protein [Pseudomonadales bacterium]